MKNENTIFSILIFLLLVSSASLRSEKFIFEYETPRILVGTCIIISISILLFLHPKAIRIFTLPFVLVVFTIGTYALNIPQQNFYFLTGVITGLLLFHFVLSTSTRQDSVEKAFFLPDFYRQLSVWVRP